jgi:tetratricopeptide (TPR) repeat protein
MKAVHTVLWLAWGLAGAFFAVSALAQPTAFNADTPATKRIEAAQSQIKADPKRIQSYNELAAAFIVRARESSNPSYYKDAESALAKGFSLDQNNFQLRKTRIALLLGEEKYDQAREQGLLLNKQTPDDVAVYGYIAQSAIALGDYNEAEKSAQWMLNMLPNNVLGLLLGADLRVVYGDSDGALDFLDQALAETPPTETEELAWIANKIAAIDIETGKTTAAEQTLSRAEVYFPYYRETLMNLGRVRMAQHRVDAAVALFGQAAQIQNDPCVVYERGNAQGVAGAAAQGIFAQAEKPTADVANDYGDTAHCGVLLKADRPKSAAEALRLAEHLIAVRHDVWTLDAYAWALCANGQYTKADAVIQKAIAGGIQNAQIFDHAGHIAQRLNHTVDAAKYFELSLRTNPDSSYAEDAKMQLERSRSSAEMQRPSRVASPPTSHEETVPAESPASGTSDAASSVLENSKSDVPVFPAIPDELLIPRPTESGRMIRAAQARVKADPKDAQALAALGAAYFQRARETADVSDFELAEQSLKASLQLDSAGFAAAVPLGVLSEVSMGEHRFEDALAFAQKALALGSGDVSPFAIAGDAYADMGDYDRAAQSYARMTPPDTTLPPRAAYARDSRFSYLKFIAGDTLGAIQLMKSAVAEGVESQIPSENLAWLHFELGECYTQAGDTAAADAAYRTALSIHPGDYRALASLARLRANHGRYDDAIRLYQKAIAVVPMPIFIAELGDVYAKTGNQVEAEKQYLLVEYIGRLGRINQVLHNRDLAVFYADHDRKLPEALDLARKEFEVRHDVYTWDALAWALYKNGKYDEAYPASQNALKFGTRDALLFYHCGVIATKLGRADEARQHMADALEINPHFHLNYADAARVTLSSVALADLSKASVDGHGR